METITIYKDTANPVGCSSQEDEHPTGLTVLTPQEQDEPTALTEGDHDVKTIPKDYFLLKTQRVNTERRDNDDDWIRLRKETGDVIDGLLKGAMVVEAQRINICMYTTGGEQVVNNFSEIGKAWKYDGSTETASKVNRALNGQFAEKKGYEYDIEKKVMQQIKVQYPHDAMGKGCIAMMVVRRKSELAKTTNKRSTKTHEGRIITKRTTIETKDEGQRKPKVKESFKVINNKKSQWYDKDGCEYTGDTKKKYTKCVSENDFLLTKIAELEKKIETQRKVRICIYYLSSKCISLTHSSFSTHRFNRPMRKNGGRRQLISRTNS